jgi:hypothetical protein
MTFILRFIDVHFRGDIMAKICRKPKINYALELHSSSISHSSAILNHGLINPAPLFEGGKA